MNLLEGVVNGKVWLLSISAASELCKLIPESEGGRWPMASSEIRTYDDKGALGWWLERDKVYIYKYSSRDRTDLWALIAINNKDDLLRYIKYKMMR